MRRQTCRLVTALLLATLCSLLLLQHCRLASQHTNVSDEDFTYTENGQSNAFVSMVEEHKLYTKELHLQIAQLKHKISRLQQYLKDRRKDDRIHDSREHNEGEKSYHEEEKARISVPDYQRRESIKIVSSPVIHESSSSPSSEIQDPDSFCSSIVQQQIADSEILKPFSLNNEYEVVPFSYFTWSRIYPSELGLGKRVVEKPIGFRRKDVLSAMTVALQQLNQHQLNRFSVDDFVEGEYRSVPTSGTQFELIFRERQANHSVPLHYRRVRLLRPFAPLTVVTNERLSTRQLINIILPLAGRLDTFQSFMEKLVMLILRHDRRLFLTVVYFGEEGLHDVRDIITKSSRQANFRHIRLLSLNETFSRGKALQVGATHWSRGDVLLFMCDVDIIFSTRFLERCRMNASPGKSVFYPVVFSLYNPNLVYPLQGKPVPQELDQLVISRETGFWRDFGYGMTCQYRSDFLNVQGFDESIVGWGGEDVLLYRKYVKSNLAVIRSTDPGIFHLWHPKFCSIHLSPDQYKACLTSRALSEASHAQLGLVAFKEDLEKHPLNGKLQGEALQQQIQEEIDMEKKNVNTEM